VCLLDAALLQPLADGDAVETHPPCKGARGVTLSRQRTDLRTLGLVRLPSHTIDIPEPARVPIRSQVVRSRGRRLKRQPGRDGATIDAKLARERTVRAALTRQRVDLGNARLACGLAQLPALVLGIVGSIRWWRFVLDAADILMGAGS